MVQVLGGTMRRRQTRALVAGAPPAAAAAMLADSNLSLDERNDILTEAVFARWQHRLRGETLARACHAWYDAVRSGAWSWDNYPSLPGYLATIERTARSTEHRHQHRRIGRHLVAGEPVSHVDFDVEDTESVQAEIWADAILDHTPTADMPSKVLVRRAALLAQFFEETIELSPISESQARAAIQTAKTVDVNQVAAHVAQGRSGSGDVAAVMFPFLSGQPTNTRQAVLETFAAWPPERCLVAIRLLCYFDYPRSGPARGRRPAHICPAKLAPNLVSFDTETTAVRPG